MLTYSLVPSFQSELLNSGRNDKLAFPSSVFRRLLACLLYTKEDDASGFFPALGMSREKREGNKSIDKWSEAPSPRALHGNCSAWRTETGQDQGKEGDGSGCGAFREADRKSETDRGGWEAGRQGVIQLTRVTKTPTGGCCCDHYCSAQRVQLIQPSVRLDDPKDPQSVRCHYNTHS